MRKNMKSMTFLLTALWSVFGMVWSITGCAKKEDPGAGKKDLVTIQVEVFDRGSDGGRTRPDNNRWTQWIQEKLLKDENIKVEFFAISRWDETSALINLMAAGNPPDVCLTYSGANITNWSEQGGVFDMAPYINTTLKDLNEFLGPDRALPGRRMIERQKNNESGRIYAIPARRMNVARFNTFMRKDWLDALGLPVPKTTQEFFNALRAFKERDPGGVGAGRVVPFSMTGIRVDMDACNLLDSFIDPALSRRERWINSVAERSFLVPGYKEGVRFLNTMYNAGLVDRDFPLYKDGEPFANLIKSGVVGSFIQSWDQIYRDSDNILLDLQKNIPGADLVPVDCFTSSDGLTHKVCYDAAGVFFFIPKSSKHPEAAMRYLNWLSKYENYHFIQTGPEGVVHTLVDGVPKLNAAAPDGWIQNSPQNIDYTMMMNGLFLGSEEENIRALASGYSWPAARINEAYTLAMTNASPSVVISPKAPLLAEGPLGQTLTDKAVVVYTNSIMAPPGQFDAVFDAQVKDWLNSGARKVIDERREKYAEP